VRGATLNGARALGLPDRGQLATGLRADFALWELEHPRELAYWFGHQTCRRSIVGAADTSAPATALHPPGERRIG
jgi:imidazolonepropionase